MKFYIKEWDDETVTLMTEMGHVLAYFPSVYEALTACEEWYLVNDKEQKHDIKIQSRYLSNPGSHQVSALASQ